MVGQSLSPHRSADWNDFTSVEYPGVLPSEMGDPQPGPPSPFHGSQRTREDEPAPPTPGGSQSAMPPETPSGAASSRLRPETDHPLGAHPCWCGAAFESALPDGIRPSPGQPIE